MVVTQVERRVAGLFVLARLGDPSALEPIGMVARGIPLGDVLRWALMGTEERITAETALRESEERFRAVFESAEDAIFIKDDRFRFTMINPGMEPE